MSLTKSYYGFKKQESADP